MARRLGILRGSSQAAEHAQDEEEEEEENDEDVELEEHVSQQLICPISHRIMDLPVISPAGHTYDRESILAWLARRPVDPISNLPLAAASLYPNRALQDEVVEQLERLAEDGKSSTATREVRRLGRAAIAKLEAVRAARAAQMGRATLSSQEVTWLDSCSSRFASCAVWFGLLATEQVLVLSTSFGAVFLLAVDSFHHVNHKTGRSYLLSNFFRLAVGWPALAMPRHWRAPSRCSALALRCAVLVPVASFLATFTLGSVFSVARFAERCLEVRAYECEEMFRNDRYMRLCQVCSSLVGIGSLGVALRLYKDHAVLALLRASHKQ